MRRLLDMGGDRAGAQRKPLAGDPLAETDVGIDLVDGRDEHHILDLEANAGIEEMRRLPDAGTDRCPVAAAAPSSLRISSSKTCAGSIQSLRSVEL